MDRSEPGLLLPLLVLYRQGKLLRVNVEAAQDINLYVYGAILLTNHESELADLIHRA